MFPHSLVTHLKVATPGEVLAMHVAASPDLHSSPHSVFSLGVAARTEMNASSGAPKDPSQGTHMQSLGDTGAGRSSHSSWVEVINFRGSVCDGNSMPQQSNSSWDSWETAHMASPPAIPSPLQNGWQWSARAGKPGLHANAQGENCSVHPQDESIDLYDPEVDELSLHYVDGGVFDDDDELLHSSEDDFSDGIDSDDSQKSNDTRKKNKWLRPFFEALDNLSLEQINEQARQWHCPACQGGPGAINWYTGLQPLMTHAKTKGRIRMRLHRELAELLEEELRRRGTFIIPAGEAFGKWKSLCGTTADHEIVWPPMVVVMNTLLEKEEKDKWKGMGNQELLEYFNNYGAIKARHSYSPNGHRGMSILIFEASAIGYLEADWLHKQFRCERRDRDAWERGPVLFYPGGKRLLYGFLASKEDVIIFNKHSHGKACLKFDMRSYQEMVVSPMKQMSEDNQKLIWLENEVVKQEQRSKVLEKSFGVVSQKLRDTMAESRLVRLRTKIQCEENKEEMDYQEKFIKDQMDKMLKITEDKERTFENLLQEQAEDNQSDVNYVTIVDNRERKEDIQRLISSQLKDVEDYEAESEKLIQTHEEKKIELKQKHLAEAIELENNFDADLMKLIEKYAPPALQNSSSS